MYSRERNKQIQNCKVFGILHVIGEAEMSRESFAPDRNFSHYQFFNDKRLHPHPQPPIKFSTETWQELVSDSTAALSGDSK